jgi:cellulose synthase/poly-beta-1,6-N-acetylglucosamine synthase-like glycosyltransferase
MLDNKGRCKRLYDYKFIFFIVLYYIICWFFIFVATGANKDQSINQSISMYTYTCICFNN